MNEFSVLQIEKVKERFEKLQVLSNNNWVKESPKPIAVKRPRTGLPAASGTLTQNPEALKEKPKASAGLRAFLAGLYST